MFLLFVFLGDAYMCVDVNEVFNTHVFVRGWGVYRCIA